VIDAPVKYVISARKDPDIIGIAFLLLAWEQNNARASNTLSVICLLNILIVARKATVPVNSHRSGDVMVYPLREG
jgi:hypothetical protein